MSFNDGINPERVSELEAEVDRLKEVNGSLCAEINRQERVIERRAERIRELESQLERALLAESGLQKVSFGLTERVRELESLVRFMEPFFLSAVSHECGCPDGYFEPHGCDDGCKALKELDDRLDALGMEVER